MVLAGWGRCFMNKPVRCSYFAADIFFFQLEMKQLEGLIRIEADEEFSAGST